MYAKEYFHPFNPTPQKNKPLIVVGPSGVGKRTLIDFVLAEYGDIFDRKRSYTTRAKRGDNEKAVENYIFVSEAEFSKMVELGQFIEHNKDRCPDGPWYGTA